MAQQQLPQTIAGTVRGRDGQPVAQARVYFTAAPGSFPDVAALTDDRGMFVLPAAAEGAYSIACSADGFATVEADVVVSRLGPRQAILELVLDPENG